MQQFKMNKKKLKRIIDMKTYRYVSGYLWTEKMFLGSHLNEQIVIYTQHQQFYFAF